MLKATDLSYSYGPVTALRDCSLAVAPGAVLGLLGPNGSGKTTTLSILCGLVLPDAGTVTVAGLSPRSAEGRALIGVAEQQTALYPHLTPRENLRVFASMQGVPRRRRDGAVDDVVGRLGLRDFADRQARTLSGGQQRLVHVGVAMIHNPAFLLLDEPSVGLDVDARRSLHDLIRQLASQGTGILLSSHYLDEVQRLCDEVTILRDGQVVATEAVATLIDQFCDPWIELEFASEAVAPATALVRSLPDIDPIVEGACMRFQTSRPGDVLRRVLRTEAVASGLTGLTVSRPGLEQVLQTITPEPILEDTA